MTLSELIAQLKTDFYLFIIFRQGLILCFFSTVTLAIAYVWIFYAFYRSFEDQYELETAELNKKLEILLKQVYLKYITDAYKAHILAHKYRLLKLRYIHYLKKRNFFKKKANEMNVKLQRLKKPKVKR